MLKPTPIGSTASPPEEPPMTMPAHETTLRKLAVVIPARDEAGCIASTVEHLHMELRLHGIDHEIIVAYVWLKSCFSRGDYGRQPEPAYCEEFPAKAA